jgi:two-component system sensor histidine kinase UhpB
MKCPDEESEALQPSIKDAGARREGELHDSVLQHLTSLALRLTTVRIQLPPDSETKAEIREVEKELIQTGAEIRHLSHELHPVLLQEAGPHALCSYCEEFSKVRGISVSRETDENVAELSPGAVLCLYRIAQEAFGNIGKHSQAKHVEILLRPSNGNVLLSVSDDGVGFNPNTKSKGLGLINMRERVHQLNGTFEFHSEPGRGTTVRATVPFNQLRKLPRFSRLDLKREVRSRRAQQNGSRQSLREV